MIRLENIVKTYLSSDMETTALNQVNLALRTGEFLAVMGQSGSGKSTLLNVLGLLEPCQQGHYWFDGQDLTQLSRTKLQQFRSRNFGYIFQNFNLIDELSVEQNVELPLLYQGLSSKVRQQRVDEVLERLQMSHRRYHLPVQLSGGQQQRVAVARALVGQPRLILADEPTGNLDSATGLEVMQLLTELHHKGSTIFMVTHSADHAAMAGRIVQMKDGVLTNDGQMQLAAVV